VLEHGVEGSVIYFADDDNTYDLRLFPELRRTRSLAVFPVGLVTKTGISSPIVRGGRVIGFFDGWIANRKFPVDMAGFAFSLSALKKVILFCCLLSTQSCLQAVRRRGRLEMPFAPGYEEDGFLRLLGVSPGWRHSLLTLLPLHRQGRRAAGQQLHPGAGVAHQDTQVLTCPDLT
jgi:beta-1,3-glucuronyltransferase